MYSVYLVRKYSHYLRFTLRLALKVLKILRFTWEDSTQQLIGRVSETWRWKPALKGLHWVRLEMWRQGVPGGARLLRLPRFSPTSRFQTVFFWNPWNINVPTRIVLKCSRCCCMIRWLWVNVLEVLAGCVLSSCGEGTRSWLDWYHKSYIKKSWLSELSTLFNTISTEYFGQDERL